MDYIKNPNRIEGRSFEIISEIIGETRPDYKFRTELEEKIIKRAIHTTADFEYLDILKINKSGDEIIKKALENGAVVYTDTNMALSGINKRKLAKLGGECICLVADERTVKRAQEKGITRSMAAVEIALEDDRKKVFVFGNAPTALFRLLELDPECSRFEAVVGVPVGFVGAAESKAKLDEADIPSILSVGRKGGSNLAAAIVNAVLYDIDLQK